MIVLKDKNEKNRNKSLQYLMLTFIHYGKIKRKKQKERKNFEIKN
jgi:hypothetical protein